MFTTDEMKWAIDLADKCIKKGLWLHAYKLCEYTRWRYEQSEWIVEPVQDFERLSAWASRKKNWLWHHFTDEERAAANSPILNRSFDEYQDGLGKELDNILQDKWNYPQ